MRKLQSSEYLPTLDGWRAIAILGVLICHASAGVLNPGGAYPNPRLFLLTRYGALGVDVFFGISGFLICTRLLQEEQKRGRISLKDFYIRRAFRILPPYLLYLVILGLLAAAGLLVVRRWEWLSCALFFRNYLALDLGGWYTAHFWSLAVEEHFYLLWPGVLFFCGSRSSRRLVIALALALAAWRAFEFRHGLIAHLLPEVGFYTRTDIRIDALLWGCWLALLLQDPSWHDHFRRWLSPSLWLGLVALYVACVALGPPLALLWQSILIPLILAATVLRPQSWVSRFLETSPLRWVGRISYGLYLWQQLFLVGNEVQRPLPLGFVQRLPFSIMAVFISACLSYYLMERRMIRVGHALTCRRVSSETIEPGVQPVLANTASA
jgi:peptidoglycan/LPS O-acetylase OafA/YrhL